MKAKTLNQATPKPPREVEIKIFKHKNGQVIMDLGRPMSWMGFTPKQAREIADMLVKIAAAGEN